MEYPRNLAELRRALAVPGVSVIGVRNDILADMPERMASFLSERPVVKAQTNGFCVRQPDGSRSWLQYGSAHDWSFSGDTFARLTLRGVIAYRLVFPNPESV